jgi:type III pantothenate kinase
MTLLVDIGNTRVKWALAEGTALGEDAAAEHGGNLAACLEASWARLRRPRRMLVANVAGDTAGAVLTGWALGRWGVTPEFLVAAEVACGVRNAYAQPGQLGPDRWAGLVGAWFLYHEAVCVVDCGTAVTLDVLSDEGEHLGGLILPGLAMMRGALVTGTRGVRPAGEVEVALLARNTAGAVAGGTLYALVAAVDRIAADVSAEAGHPVRLVLTGGDADTLRPLLAGRWSHHPELVLQGLAVIAEQLPGGAL